MESRPAMVNPWSVVCCWILASHSFGIKTHGALGFSTYIKELGKISSCHRPCAFAGISQLLKPNVCIHLTMEQVLKLHVSYSVLFEL